jgi:putative endonuclease
MTASAARLISAQTRRDGGLLLSRAAAQSAGVVTDRQQLGTLAEERAARHLQQAGCDIVARNFRCRLGELDIIARRGRLLIIAEVRLRTHAHFGGAAGSITCAKRARIVRATRYLLTCRPYLATLIVRFDTLLLSAADGPIEWIEGAFDCGAI